MAVPVFPDPSRPGVAMFLPLLSALAIGLASVAILLTVAIPFVLGCFGRRDTY